MEKTVAEMTQREFREMLDSVIDQKLTEILGDPDEGQELRQSVRERLIRQRSQVAAGDRGQSFEDAVSELGLG